MMHKISPTELSGIGDLLRKALEIYKPRMWTLVVLTLVMVFLPALVLAALIGAGALLFLFLPDFRHVILLASILPASAATIWCANWALTALFTAIADDSCGIKEAFRLAKPVTLAHIWLTVLMGLVIAGGYMLLIVPGVVLTVWFFFAPLILINEDVRGMEALLKSKEYVRGRWLGVCWRLIAVWFISIVISCIPVIGQLLAFLFIPFSFVCSFLIYQELRSIRANMPFEPTQRAKTGFVAVGALPVLATVVLFVFISSMLFMSVGTLKAKLIGGFPATVTVGEGKPHRPTPNTARTLPPAGVDKEADIQILNDKNISWTGRSQAASRLGRAMDKRAVAPLIHALESDDNVFVRRDAATALAKLGDTRAVGALKRALKNQETITTFQDGKTAQVKVVARAAAEALKKLGAPEEPAKLNDALEAYTVAIEINPQNAAAYYNRAVAHYGLGNYQEAVDDFTKAIELEPKNGKAYYNRAIVYGALGRNKDAIEDGTKAIELNPKDPNAYINRGIDYIGPGNYEKAVADLNKAIELNAQDAAAYYARGYAHQKLSTFERALPDFRKSAKMGYKKAEAYLRSRTAL